MLKRSVTNCDESKTLPYFPINQLAFLLYGCWLKTQDSWVRNKTLSDSRHIRQHWFSQLPSPKEVIQRGPAGCYTQIRFRSQLRILKLQSIPGLMRGLLANLSRLCPQGKNFFNDHGLETSMSSSLESEPISIISMLQISLGRQFVTKARQKHPEELPAAPHPPS